jgi:hypothetical protein
VSREDENGFIGRWSRLKRAQARPEPAPVEEPPAEPVPPEPEPETLSEEELAALPRIEDLVEGSDIRPFLRAGVPRQLRNAALRRMWMLTPAIRDYRDPAVDYAWDWNTPGGVPGDGVAPSPERAAEMLRDLLAPRPERAPERQADATEAAEETAPMPVEEQAAEQRAEADDAGADGSAPEPLPRPRHGSALPG